MANNKVELSDGTTIMDITDTTAEESDVASGKTFYKASGQRATGTGSGGGSDVFIAEYDLITSTTIIEAIDAEKVIYVKRSDLLFLCICARYDSNTVTLFCTNGGVLDLATKIIVFTVSRSDSTWALVTNYNLATATQVNAVAASIPGQATDSVLGTVKLNPDESVTLNADGQLDVGGRLGQMSNSTGVYAPKSINPAEIGNGSFLLTEGSGTTLGNKSLAVSTGTNITCRSAAANSTVYKVQNTYENRIKCSLLAAAGGVIALNEAEAMLGKYATIQSVLINGETYVPDSSANQSSTTYDIVITVDKTINPSAATTTIRAYPCEKTFSNLFVGQGVGGDGAGASVIVGQGVMSQSGNACALIGASIYNAGNGNGVFGRQHISKKNRWFMAGTGHDNSGGKSESGAAFGEWADIQSDTLFAIGNGTSHTARSNAFEIKTNGDIYKNGTKVL